MRPHEIYMHLDLLDSIPKSGLQRRKIMDFVRSLRDHPAAPGDFSDKDESLREGQIKIVGDHAVTYWLDAPARVVMIVAIRPADQ